MSVNKNNNPNDFPLYLFYQGKNYEAYKFFGVHSKKKGKSKVFVNLYNCFINCVSI